MRALTPYNPSSRLPLAASRAIARMNAETEVKLAAVENVAALQAQKVGAVAYVGRRALHEVAMLGLLEGELSALMPRAAGRLEVIGTLAALDVADVVSDTVRKLSR